MRGWWASSLTNKMCSKRSGCIWAEKINFMHFHILKTFLIQHASSTNAHIFTWLEEKAFRAKHGEALYKRELMQTSEQPILQTRKLQLRGAIGSSNQWEAAQLGREGCSNSCSLFLSWVTWESSSTSFCFCFLLLLLGFEWRLNGEMHMTGSM